MSSEGRESNLIGDALKIKAAPGCNLLPWPLLPDQDSLVIDNRNLQSVQDLHPSQCLAEIFSKRIWPVGNCYRMHSWDRAWLC